MPVSADTLRLLMTAGIAGQELIDVVASIDADHESAPKARTAHALRQERYRQRKASQNVTSDASLGAEQVSPKEIPPTPPKEITPSQDSPDTPKGVPSPPIEADAAIRAYSEMATRQGLAVPRVLTAGRRSRLNATLRQHGLPAWLEAVGKVGASAFCCGQNDRGWKADLDFLLQAKTFPKILEGAYDNRAPQARGSPQAALSQADVFAMIAKAPRHDDQPEPPEDRSSLRQAIPHLSAVRTG